MRYVKFLICELKTKTHVGRTAFSPRPEQAKASARRPQVFSHRLHASRYVPPSSDADRSNERGVGMICCECSAEVYPPGI